MFGIEAMQSHMISQPVKSLMKYNFTIIYQVYNWNGGPWRTSYNNVWAIAMYFLAYNVCIKQSESIWYVVEQYGEKTDRKIGYEPPAVMHSWVTTIDVQYPAYSIE